LLLLTDCTPLEVKTSPTLLLSATVTLLGGIILRRIILLFLRLHNRGYSDTIHPEWLLQAAVEYLVEDLQAQPDTLRGLYPYAQ
jgi:hypothetical protein